MLYTCTKESESFIVVKNSKFSTYCFPTDCEIDFQKKLLTLKNQYPGANHHCYAYRIGKQNIKERANDDGEPSGSAGLPILNAIKSASLSNCAVVVVRFFGGVKLGTSGLIKSYRQGAQESIENNVLAILELHYFCKVTFPYETTSVVEQIIHREGLKIEDKNFSKCVEMTLSSNKPIYQLILSELMRFSECQVEDLGSQ
jgi:uncharacterized YigZ family protein